MQAQVADQRVLATSILMHQQPVRSEQDQQSATVQQQQQQQLQQYSLEGVINFLQALKKSKQEWEREKTQLRNKLSHVERELYLQLQINQDLRQRVRELDQLPHISPEQAAHYHHHHHRVKSDLTNLRNFDLQNVPNFEENSNNSQTVQRGHRRKVSQKPVLLNKFLEEVGLEDESNTDEKESLVDERRQKKLLVLSQVSLNELNKHLQHETEGARTRRESTYTSTNTVQGNTPTPHNNVQPTTTSLMTNLNVGLAQTGSQSSNPSIAFIAQSAMMLESTNRRQQSSHSHVTCTASDREIVSGRKFWQPKCVLRSHLDGVRGIFFCANSHTLATVSEDCLVKLWDAAALRSAAEDILPQHIEPQHTLREHSGPLFTVTGNQQDPNNIKTDLNLLFTAGSDSVIRAWRIPTRAEPNNYGPSEHSNFLVSSWQDSSEEVVWELNHHAQQPIMLSSHADGAVKLWRTLDAQTHEVPENNFLRAYHYTLQRENGLLCADTPTSVAWECASSGGGGIVSGYARSSNVVVFDLESARIKQVLKYAQDRPHQNDQVNKLLTHANIKYIVAGYEDRFIRFFDSQSNKMIKCLIGHTDAVTSLSLDASCSYLASVSHDGSMRTWDIRKFQCIHEIPAHKRKYDESVHAVLHYYSYGIIATAGADGLIKIFQQADHDL